MVEAIGAAEAQLGARGRVVVRYSGTEIKCRVMVEGDEPAETEGIADAISSAIVDAVGDGS